MSTTQIYATSERRATLGRDVVGGGRNTGRVGRDDARGDGGVAGLEARRRPGCRRAFFAEEAGNSGSRRRKWRKADVRQRCVIGAGR